MNPRTALFGGVAAVTLGVLLSLAGCRDHSLSRLRKAGVIRVGYAVEAPFSFVLPDGTVTGEGPEIARAIAERLGIRQIRWRQVEFDLLIEELLAGNIDVIAAGMHVTPERAARVRFSQPTIRVRQALLVRAGNPHHLHSIEDLVRDESTRLAVLRGSVEQALATRLGLPAARVVLVSDVRLGQSAVESGAADALALTRPTLQWIVRNQSVARCELAEPPEASADQPDPDQGLAAFAFRLEDHALAHAWDEALSSYLGSPEHLELISRFGFAPADVPTAPDPPDPTGP